MKYIIGGLLSFSLAAGFAYAGEQDSFEDKVRVAHSIINERKAKIAQANEYFRLLKEKNKQEKHSIEKNAPSTLSPVLYHVQRTQLDWALPNTFRYHQDYAITMDFGVREHQHKLDALYLGWINDGWFIESSKIITAEDAPKNQSTVNVRLVKVK